MLGRSTKSGKWLLGRRPQEGLHLPPNPTSFFWQHIQQNTSSDVVQSSFQFPTKQHLYHFFWGSWLCGLLVSSISILARSSASLSLCLLSGFFTWCSHITLSPFCYGEGRILREPLQYCDTYEVEFGPGTHITVLGKEKKPVLLTNPWQWSFFVRENWRVVWRLGRREDRQTKHRIGRWVSSRNSSLH